MILLTFSMNEFEFEIEEGRKSQIMFERCVKDCLKSSYSLNFCVELILKLGTIKLRFLCGFTLLISLILVVKYVSR